jgi:uncharacterized repeat protein (TIGR03806 family)
LVYVWDQAQSDARLEIAPDPVKVQWDGMSIDYSIPNTNQCKACHDQDKVTQPIGPTARQLNREKQLETWVKIGYLTGAPANPARTPVWDDASSGSIEARARGYIEINCAHCHSRQGSASNTGLYLAADEIDPVRLGICKPPVAAGAGSGDLLYSVVPGRSAESILVWRMESTAPKVMMPEIGRTIVHREALALIRQWIDNLKGGCGT